MSRMRIDRRTFVLGLSSALTLPLTLRQAHAAGTRVLIVGGSAMVGALGAYLATALEKAGYLVERKAKSSSGLARPDFYDWPTVAAKAYASFQPHATVVMFGGNDGQGLKMPRGSDPEWIRWHEDEWTEEYAQRVKTFAQTVAPDNEYVFWLGMPPMRQRKLNARIDRMNTIFETVMSARTNGYYVETASALSDQDGNYADSVVVDGKRVRVRAPDGVHFNREGAHHLVGHIVPFVRKYLAVSS